MHPYDPYDPDLALEAIRPRLAQARARRRKAAGASTALIVLAASSIAAAAVLGPTEDAESVIAVSPDSTIFESTGSDLPAETSPLDSLGDEVNRQAPGSETVEPHDEPKHAAAPATEDKPPAPPPAHKESTSTTHPPTSTTAAPVAQQHTFTYPGTGSVTVSQTGSKLTFVSASAQPGWTYHLSHNSHDLIGVEFKNGNIQRWLKIKVINGVVVADQHEQVMCVPPAGNYPFEVPHDAGTFTVNVDGSGKLSLGGMNPAEGWQAEVWQNEAVSVKVNFWSPDQAVWVRVKVHDCTLKTESG